MDAFINLLTDFAIPTVVVAAIFVAILLFVLPREVRTIFKRELSSYFTSPIAYVLFVVFLGISNTLSFFFTGVLEGGEAALDQLRRHIARMWKSPFRDAPLDLILARRCRLAS